MTPDDRWPELQLVVTWRRRRQSLLGPPAHASWAEPSIDEIVNAAQRHGEARCWVVSGGEPTLRADLPELLEALSGAGAPRLAVATDGLALASEDAVLRLVGAGLRRVRLWFHSARPHANDWLMGLNGAARRAFRALRTCRAAGLELEAAVAVTRPTTPHLAETVRVLARIGVSRVVLHRPQTADLSSGCFAGLSPRFAAATPWIERTVDTGRRRGLDVRLAGFPPCACGAAHTKRLTGNCSSCVVPAAGDGGDALHLHQPLTACALRAGCRWSGACEGAPSDYVATFGWHELRTQAPAPDVATEAPSPPSEHPVPPPRAGRGPVMQRSFVIRQADRGELVNDPLWGLEPRPPEQPVTVIVRGPGRVRCPSCAAAGSVRGGTRRALRQALLGAAQEGAVSLRLIGAGAVAQPWALDVIADALRLPFSRVELATEVSPLDIADDAELARLGGLARLDGALFGPDAASHDAHMNGPGAFEAAMRVLVRVSRLGVTTSAFAVLHDGDRLPAWHEAWASGRLPGEPAFRLCRLGGSLNELAEYAARLEDGPAQRALARSIPPCLLPRDRAVAPARAAVTPWNPSAEAGDNIVGSDPLGSFETCPLATECGASASCPGLAAGWSVSGLRARPKASGIAS